MQEQSKYWKTIKPTFDKLESENFSFQSLGWIEVDDNLSSRARPQLPAFWYVLLVEVPS